MNMRFTTVLPVIIGLVLIFPESLAPEGHSYESEAPGFDNSQDLAPVAHAGADAVVRVGEPVSFWGSGSSPEYEIVEYAWDFDGDGVDDLVLITAVHAEYTFSEAGTYRCLLTVRDSQGQTARDTRRVIVIATESERAKALESLRPSAYVVRNEPDGVIHRYAVMINGGSEERFWIDVELGYDMLINGYGFSPDDVYLLNSNGTDYYGNNPDGMIDYEARLEYVDSVFAELAEKADLDDEVFVWITDHGYGYIGPTSNYGGGRYFGYLAGRASVDPGDEPDYPESGFKLRSLMTCSDYMSWCNHGLNVWVPCKLYYSPNIYRFYRRKYVSRFDGIYVESLDSTVTDEDIFIECLNDYALGDTNRDGLIDANIGEVYDFDGDGDPPYDPADSTYDEDDWGEIDGLIDDFNNCNTGVPEGGYPYRIFDDGFQGKLCIDLAYAGGTPEVDGCDEDNAGLFDWMDANQDGDIDDTISIDEEVCLPLGPLADDELAVFIGRLSVAKVTTVAMQCFSGGLIEDLSVGGRSTSTATTEEDISSGNGFIRDFTAALHGIDMHGLPVEADMDGNGYVSMAEAFNFAAPRNDYSHIPQYDDNGDGISQEAPVPAGGDGEFGAATYLCDIGTETVATPDFDLPGGFYQIPKIIHVTCGTPGATIRYTTDDSDPTPASPECIEGAVLIDHRLVLKARAYKDGYLPSDVAEEAYFLPGINIVHVKPGGDDGGDGSSWATAKQTIAGALSVASAGDDIWIKGDSGAVYVERITVPAGIAVYGGFEGDEIMLDERPPFPRPGCDSIATIIDGGGAGTVVTIESGASAITLIDGCTIRNGSAFSGGGLYIGSGTPSILGCSIVENRASYRGGGIYCDSYSSPTIGRCLIAGNEGNSYAGGLYATNGCSPTIYQTVIADNSTGGYGGGLYFYSYSAYSDPEVINCIIINNAAGSYGGSLFCRDNSSLALINCTVTGNTSSYSGGGVHYDECTAEIDNCIIRDNSATYYGDNIKLQSGAALTVSYTNVPTGNPSVHTDVDCVVTWGEGCIDTDPLFTDPDGFDDDPGTWKDNEYQLLVNSPCIDAGDNDALPAGFSADVEGYPRRIDCLAAAPDPGHGTPPIVDMGACEWQYPSNVDAEPLPLYITALRQNYPNPFNPSTVVSFSIRDRGRVVIRIYDVSGRLVTALVDAIFEPGAHTVTWNGTNTEGRHVASGIYFYRMKADGAIRTKKMVLLR